MPACKSTSSVARFISSLNAVVTGMLSAFVLLCFGGLAHAQTINIADSAVPKVIVPGQGTSQFFILNADGSLQAFSTVHPSSYTVNCAAPADLSTSVATSQTLTIDEFNGAAFQTGATSASTPAVVGRGVPYSGSGCTNSSAVPVTGASTVLLAAEDSAHHRLFLVSSGGGAAHDTISYFSTGQVEQGNPSNQLPSLGSDNLGSGGVYTSIATDSDGLYGDTAITEMRTDASAGGLWVFNSTFAKAVKVLGPGGTPLPAIGSFIIHNPTDGGGGLLVLVNQDGLTSSNITNPPTDTAPFTIIDLGQLHDLLSAHPTASTVTLPFVATISSSLGYYAMLGAAYNPVNHLLYAIVGGGTSVNDIYRSVVSYDPYSPSTPSETVVGDVSSLPLISSQHAQLALDAAGQTLQILATDSNQLYTISLVGTGNTARQYSGSPFADSTFVPTYIASNALLGETYIASANLVDIINRPDGVKAAGYLDLTGSESITTVGQHSLALLAYFPDLYDTALGSTDITITASANGIAPYTFATVNAYSATGLPRLVAGNFPSSGIYTLTASYPGDDIFSPVTSRPVIVAVAAPLFATSISLGGSFDTSTGAATGAITLTGSTYTPSGTVKILSGNTGNTLVTYTLTGSLVTPITVNFTAPPSTTTFQAQYSGDTLNQPSTSQPVVLQPPAKTTPTLVFSSPATGAVEVSVPLTLSFQSTSGVTPTGNIQVTASSSQNPFVFVGSVAASDAAAGNVGIDWKPTAAGTYTFSLYYAGDANYSSVNVGVFKTVTIAPPTAVSFTLSTGQTAAANTNFNIVVVMQPTGSGATGNITLSAVKAGTTTPISLGSVSAVDASGATGTVLSAQLPSAGVYTVTGSYAGDGTFAAVNSANSPVVTITDGVNAAVMLTPVTASFSSPMGVASLYQAFTLYNTGGATLNISSITTTGAGFAQINGCGATLASGANCQLRVNFVPGTVGTVNGSLVVTDSASGSPHTATLTGAGTAPLIAASPTTVSFIDQTIGTSSFVRPTVTVTNSSTSPVTITAASLSNTTDFELLANNCSVGTLVTGNGGKCMVQVVFHPSSAGAKSATLSLTTSLSAIAFTINISANGLAAGKCADADGDSLCDDWETNGVWVHTASGTDKFIDLPSMGADPKHKDIFIQADYMATVYQPKGDHSHQMKLDAENYDIAAFQSAPVSNPDGTTGIHLHIDCGFYCIMDPVKKTTWGSNSLASELPELPALMAAPHSDSIPFDWTTFDQNSTAFNNTGRALVFHHAIFGHDQNPKYTSSGISRNNQNILLFVRGASDLVVSLGSWTNQTGTAMEQAGTLMHELGHNLSLQHGGNNSINYKPNYLSVMNYNMQTAGIIMNNKQGYFDYSRFQLPDVNESMLSEPNGLNISPKDFPGGGGFPSIDHYGIYYYCPGDDPNTTPPQARTGIDSPVNFDCDAKNIISPRPVAVDINGDGNVNSYSSYNDWPNLVFSGGAVGGNGIGVDPVMQTDSGNEINQAQDSLIPKLYNVSVAGMGGVHTAPGGSITLHFTVTNTGITDDVYDLSAATLAGWTVAPGLAPRVSIAAKASADIAVTYTVPSTANDGDSDRLIVRAVSENSPNVMDSQEVRLFAATNPLPAAISVATVSFGSQNVATTSGPMPVIVTNTGNSALSVSSIATSSEFAQSSNCGASIAVGASCTIAVTFTPSAAGTRTGALTFNAGSATSIDLLGTGITPQQLIPEVTLTASPSSTSTGQTITLTASVTSYPPTTQPTGNVSFYNGTTLLGQVAINGSGSALFTSSTLAAGAYSVTAQYSGDASFRVASSPSADLTIAVAKPTTIALTSSATAVAAGTNLTFTATISGGSSGSQPSGSVVFLDGSATLGTGTLNANGVATFSTAALAAGTHTIAATYIGDVVFTASNSNNLSQYVGTFSTATALAVSATSVPPSTSVTLTATVTSTYGTPGGTVTFLDGSTTLGTGTLNASGVATYAISSLAVGTHGITAQYAATNNFTASTSTSKAITVTLPPDYAIAANPSSLTVTAGASGTATFTVTPSNAYAGTVTFACGTLPAYASCAFAPTSVTFTAATQTPQSVTLTVNTTQAHAQLTFPGRAPSIVLAFLPVALFGFSRKRRRSFRGLLLTLSLSVAAFTAIAGCGGSAKAPSVAPGTYTVPITITDGSTAHSINYTITVQ